ncbi:MAG: NfrA family protein [Giesbergeria sp.]
MAAVDQQFGEEPPLRLTMSLVMTVPGTHRPMPAPDVPGSAPHVAQLVRDPRSLVGLSLRMERAIATLANGRPDQAARVLAKIGVAPDRSRTPELAERALRAIERVEHPTWGRGPADTVVDSEFNRLLMQYVRLQMPSLPMWQAPNPGAPVQSVEPLEVLPAAPQPDAPPALASEQTARHAVKARRVTGLRGQAWRLSDQGYKAYNRGDYKTALERADAALQLAPGAVRLHQLRVYALQKLGRLDEAERAAKQAIADGHTSPELEAAVRNLQPAPAGADAVPRTAAYRKAFPIATLAYEQLATGKYADAASNAEIAVRTDPSQGDWALLWLNALEDMQRYEDMVVAGQQAIALGAPNVEAISALMRLGSQAIGVQHAQKAFDAMAKNRPKDAVPEAREAVRRAPDVVSHRLLLISALQAAQDLVGAEAAATDALLADDENATIHIQRAYLLQQLGKGEAAQADIEAVLAQGWIDDALRRDTRLIGADLALANGRPERVMALLEPLPADDAQAISRRSAAKALWAWVGKSDALPVTAYAPLQLCRDTPYGTVCEMEPWDAPGTDNPAARAYAAYGQKRYAQAIELARKAVAEDPKSAGNQTLLTTALAAGTEAEQKEALERLDTALAEKPDDADLLRQRGYLRLSNGAPALALEDFVAARNTGNAPATNLLDEAYAMAATGQRLPAAALLRQAIDDADAGKMSLDAQQRFDTRSAVASFSREWGVTASVGYRGARAPSNGLVGQPVSLPGDAAFSTVEAYWRPAEFLNSSTSTFDVYGRLSNTLHSGTDRTGAQQVPDPCGGTLNVEETRTRSASGFPTTTGAVGVRYTPWTEKNLTFGLERQFFLGNAARSGALNPSSNAVRCQLNQLAGAVDYRTNAAAGAWQAYALYGFYEGTGLRLDTNSWFTMEGYLQAGYTLLDAPTAYTLRDSTGQVLGRSEGKLKRGQAFAASEVRVGRSFLTEYSDRLVLFPHVSLAADWYSNRDRATGTPVPGNSSVALVGSGHDWSVGAGVGLNVRYWLQGDRYRAQSSYVDASLQYRTRLGGVQDRAKGVFMSLSYSY